MRSSGSLRRVVLWRNNRGTSVKYKDLPFYDAPPRYPISKLNTLDVCQVWEILCRPLMNLHRPDVQKLQWWRGFHHPVYKENTIHFAVHSARDVQLLCLRVNQVESFNPDLAHAIQESLSTTPTPHASASQGWFSKSGYLVCPLRLQVDYL